MIDRFRLTLAQLNATVGDLAGNAALALDAWAQGRDAGANMVALPEMFLTGYQTQDLVLKPAFLRDCHAALDALAAACADGPTSPSAPSTPTGCISTPPRPRAVTA